MAQHTTPEEWLKHLQNPAINDIKLANFVLTDLVHYQPDGRFKSEDIAKLLALFTALRLHEMNRTES